MVIADDVQVFVVVACAVLGLCVGSFLNVVIWRVPNGQSVVKPPSHCPKCETQLRTRDNIPVLSWLILRRRCRTCKEPISARYPAVEILTALAWAGLAWRFSDTSAELAFLPSCLWLASLGVALAAIDLDTHRLPNVLTLSAYPISALVLIAATPAQHDGVHPLIEAVVVAAAAWLFFFSLCFATGGKGMGYGDVKLSGVLGMHLGFLGWKVALVGFFGAFFLGGVVGLGVIALKGGGRKTRIPFGPFLIAGALIALMRGSELAHFWLGDTV